MGDLQRVLRRKLNAQEERASHHVYFFIDIPGNGELRVAKFSHSARGRLPDFVVADTARRLGLSRRRLDELVECTLSGDGFWELWNTAR